MARIKLSVLLSVLLACIGHSQYKLDSVTINRNLDKAYSFYYSNKDSLRSYLDVVKTLATKQRDIKNLYEAYNVDSWNAAFYADVERISKNIKTLDSLSAIFNKEFSLLPDKTYREIQFNYTKGQYYSEINNQTKSNYYFEKIIEKYNTLQASLITDEIFHLVKESYLYLAASYRDEKKFSKALEYYQKNLRLINTRPNNDALRFSTISQLANLFRVKKDYNKSNAYYINCLPYYKSLNISGNNRTITIYQYVSQNYLALGKLDSAKFYVSLLKDELYEGHSMYNTYFKSASKLCEADKNFADALGLLHKNLNFINKKWNGKENLETAEAYLLLGDYQKRQLNFEKALKNYDLALTQFGDDAISSSVNLTLKFKILKNKTSALNHLKQYDAALEATDYAISILDQLKPTFKINSDKFFLIENAFPLFESGIEAAFQLFKETKNIDYIEKAFLYSEKSKSTLLLESLLSSKATEFAKVPDKFIEKEKQLKAKITYLEKRNNSKPTAKLKDELFDLKQKRRQFIDSIEVNYKSYYDLKYNTKVITLQKLQNRLDGDTALLSYFYGNHSIYAITVTKTSKYIDKIPVDTKLETLLKDTYELLSNPNSNLTVLNFKTNKLYQKLVENSLVLNPQKKIIIIPDGLLNYLPFESLWVNSGNYLVENKVISYVNSATLLTKLQTKITNDNDEILAFAPNFETSKSTTLLPLPNNKKEVEQLLTHFKGKAYTDADATIENFTYDYKDPEIIHFATHAVINDENPEYSYLAFSKNSDKENLLYTSDIYNLELNTNMVTLSACESGIGYFRRGEGMLSLARAFYFSGSSSIASTLWKVNDASSSNLMDYFYNNLSKGKSKSEALQQAKIKFLASNKDNPLSHPYYWSCFVISGNTDALTTGYDLLYLGIALLLIIMGVGLFLFKKKR